MNNQWYLEQLSSKANQAAYSEALIRKYKNSNNKDMIEFWAKNKMSIIKGYYKLKKRALRECKELRQIKNFDQKVYDKTYQRVLYFKLDEIYKNNAKVILN